MTHLGMGVMINSLSISRNRETAEALKAAVGKTIQDISIGEEKAEWSTPDTLRFTFTDGSGLKIWDDGQSCCEHRYMYTDDELTDFYGAEFRDAEVRDGPSESPDGWGEVKESQFLIITTSVGQFTVVNYNEHNGYYGGFLIQASTAPAQEEV